MELHNVVGVNASGYFFKQDACTLCTTHEDEKISAIGVMVGYYSLRRRPEIGPIKPRLRPKSAPHPSFHIEKIILDEVSRTDPKILEDDLGSGLLIDLTQNPNLPTTRPCLRCTLMLKKRAPKAMIKFKVDGEIKKVVAENLSVEKAHPSSGDRARGHERRGKRDKKKESKQGGD